MNKGSFELRMRAKEFEREARKLQKEAGKAKKSAKKELKKGNRSMAQMYANKAIRYEQQAKQILENSATATGLSADLQAGDLATTMAKSLRKTSGNLAKATRGIKLENVSNNQNKMKAMKEKISLTHQVITGGDENELVDAGADDMLHRLEMENQMEAETQLEEIPEVPNTIPVTGTKMKD